MTKFFIRSLTLSAIMLAGLSVAGSASAQQAAPAAHPTVVQRVINAINRPEPQQRQVAAVAAVRG